jgi:hypothetical protein
MAVLTVLWNGVDNESAAEALAYVEQSQPGFNDPKSSEISFKVRFAQTIAFSAWHSAYGAEKAGRMAGDLWQVMESAGERIEDSPLTYMEVLALQGDTNSAIEFALEHVMTLPVTEAIWWHEVFDQSHMNDVTADPRIRAGLQRWDDEAIQLRENVRDYLRTRQ